MSTKTRPELSSKNKWHISKHRYYELKHFCLQYPEWKKAYSEAIKYPQSMKIVKTETTEWVDPVFNSVETMDIYRRKIALVENAALKTDEQLGRYILLAVTKGYSFTTMKMIYEIPCGKDMYYDRYRKFFYILSNCS